MISRATHEKVLIQSVINATAKYGMSNSSTRVVAQEADLKEVYIYRYFGSKDNLIQQAYETSVRSFFDSVIRYLDVIKENCPELPSREVARMVFLNLWRTLLDDPDKSKFLLAFFYSDIYAKEALALHDRQLEKITERAKGLFLDDDTASWCVKAVFELIYAAVRRVLSGQIPDDTETARKVFEDIYKLFLSRSTQWSSVDVG